MISDALKITRDEYGLLNHYLCIKPHPLQEKEKPYDIDLGRFKNHKKVFPWMFVIKVIIGLTMMAFIYYMTTELFSEESQPPLQNQDFEIEVSPD